ncbi:hypothetical protein [Bacillus cytotoxicus]|uniref:hypothetical protein n=1 Tax=Bacillus cytotoxicus TaxID=580165 RepID=UPI003D7EA2B8
MNYKQFLEVYNQGPEELYRLFKAHKKTIESLQAQLQVVWNRVLALEFHAKKTL